MAEYRSHIYGPYEVRVGHKMRFPDGTYVGRNTALGNPYKLTDGHTREEAIELYREWLDKAIKEGNKAVCEALERLRVVLSGKKTLVLCCWCFPLDCHADVIASKLIGAIDGNYPFVASPGVWTSDPTG